MADEPIIIVDDKGVEHEFPPGFDPRRAAGIVRAQSGQRQDANAIGFDVNKWTDMASKLPESVLGVPVRKPVAAAGTFLGTTVEGLSAPESIATLGIGKVPSASPNYLPPSILGKVNALGRMIEGSPSAGGKVGVTQRLLGRLLQVPKEPMAPGVEPFGPAQISNYRPELPPGTQVRVGPAGVDRYLPDHLKVPDTGIYTVPPRVPAPGEAIPGLRPSLDPHMPNTSGYGGPGSAGLNRGPLPTSSLAQIDPHMPNASGYVAGEAPSAISQALPGVSMPQATYIPIPPEFQHVYGEWGLTGAGTTLEPGMIVNATNRAGHVGLQKVGPWLVLPDGSQIATIAK